MGYTGEVRRRGYQPSKWFTALVSAFFVLSILFFVLPYIAPYSHSEVSLPPFPVSVDPHNKLIIPYSDPLASGQYFVASALQGLGDATQLAAAAIISTDVYQGLTGDSSPVAVTIPPGLRKEQVANILDRELGWSNVQRELFLDAVEEAGGTEGMLYPSTYVMHASTSPSEAYDIIAERFEERVLARYTKETEELVPVKDALTIASIIEREAGTVAEMRTISGILWNRLFVGMRLQADSTLSYARGTGRNGWWPVPRSQDKFIKSEYNTYQHAGLPPGPIASPSVPAIMAALNPEETTCLFFFHSRGDFYCSDTYEEHVAELRRIYGRGR